MISRKLGLAALLVGGMALMQASAASAQSAGDCRVAMLRFEEALLDGNLMYRSIAKDSQTFCDATTGPRSCLTGIEARRRDAKFLNDYGIRTILISRIALFPELVGAGEAGCVAKPDGTLLVGLVADRGFRGSIDKDDQLVTSVHLRSNADGSISVLAWERYSADTLPEAAKGVDPWRSAYTVLRSPDAARPAFQVTARQGPPPVSATPSPPPAPAMARAARPQPAQPAPVERMTGTGSGMSSDLASAQQQARREAEQAVANACGSRAVNITARQTSYSRSYDRLYQYYSHYVTWEATGDCSR